MTTFIKDNAEFKLFKDSFIKWCLFRFNREYPLTDKNVCNYTDEVLNTYVFLKHGESYEIKNIIFNEIDLSGSIYNIETNKHVIDFNLIKHGILNYEYLETYNKHIDDNTIS